jgi:formamidopyrimidine-DNA glycosylase
MPELPEVETTVLSLKTKVLKKTFVSIWEEKNKKELKGLLGKRIEKIERFGKGIYLFLSDSSILHIHLRMTGHLLFDKWEMRDGEWKSSNPVMQESKNGFLRYMFSFDDGGQLALSDPRKFAKVVILSEKELSTEINKIGKDALLIKKEEFFNLFLNKKREVKSFLMDQSVISGIGNIYAAEILFLAKIDPKRRTDSLKEKEIEKIYELIQSVLKKGLQLKGDSTSDYRLLDGKKGGYQNHHLVYNRKDLPCFVCKEKIKREKVGGRGTYFCPKCQK